MSLWEFAACVDGYAAAHGARRAGDIDEERLADMGIEGF